MMSMMIMMTMRMTILTNSHDHNGDDGNINVDNDDDNCSGHSNISAPLGSPAAPANPSQRSQISDLKYGFANKKQKRTFFKEHSLSLETVPTKIKSPREHSQSPEEKTFEIAGIIFSPQKRTEERKISGRIFSPKKKTVVISGSIFTFQSPERNLISGSILSLPVLHPALLAPQTPLLVLLHSPTLVSHHHHVLPHGQYHKTMNLIFSVELPISAQHPFLPRPLASLSSCASATSAFPWYLSSCFPD